MKASFDGARIVLAESFNRLALTCLSEDQIQPMSAMRDSVYALLCMYDDNVADDAHDLSDRIRLEEVP